MKKEVLAAIIVLICFAFAYADYSLNNYEESFRVWQRNSGTTEDFDTTKGELFVAPIPDTNPLLLPEDTSTQKPSPFRQTAPNDQKGSPLKELLQTNLKLNIQSESDSETLASIIPKASIPFSTALSEINAQINGSEFKVYEIDTETKKSPLSFQSIQDSARNLKESAYSVNITNKYGDASFYINVHEQADIAFLVVLLKERDYVYLFEYPKSIHGEIEALIEELQSS